MNAFLEILLWLTYLISLFFSLFWLLVFMENSSKWSTKKEKRKTTPFISVIIPAHNEENTVIKTAESVLALDYPKDKLQLIIVENGSSDNTWKVIQDWVKYKKQDILAMTIKDSGKGIAMNKALEKAKGKFFACLDADSVVEPTALDDMIKIFENDSDDLAIVTPIMFIQGPKTLVQKLQNVEYILSMFVAKLMAMVDCQYVAPGPFSLYRTNVIKSLGGFDENNLTEDQEIAYRVQEANYRITQCTKARVWTKGPDTAKGLYNQRNRWFKGGLINALSYKKLLLNKKYGDFGIIQMSINLVLFMLSTSAVVFFIYFLIWPFISQIYDFWLVGFDIWPYIKDLEFTFSVLNLDIEKLFIAYCLFAVSLSVTYFAHKMMNLKLRDHGGLVILPYFLAYYLVLSFIALVVFIEFSIGKEQKW